MHNYRVRATFQDSDAQIKEVQSAMDQVKSAASSGAAALDARLCTSGRKKQCLIIFFCTIWNMTDGENLLSTSGIPQGQIWKWTEKIQSSQWKSGQCHVFHQQCRPAE